MRFSWVFTTLVSSSLPLLVSAIWPIPSEYSTGNSVLWVRQNLQVSLAGKDVGILSQFSSFASFDSFASVLDRFLASYLPQQLTEQFAFLQRPTGNYELFTQTGKNSSCFAVDPDPASCPIGSNTILQAAVARMFDTLFERNFIPWKFYPKRAVFEPGRDGTYRGPRKEITKLTLVLKKPDPETLLRPLAGSVDESYELALNTDGTATIAANSTIGLVRGLTTMTQLFFKHSDGQVYTKLAPVKIFDAPKFPHRGLNMDVSRSYYPVKDIKRQIDALGYTKFNRLHLHITDSQSWPLVIPDLPWLTWKGAYQYDMIYTPTDISDIQYYAALHGISVVIETDMPGHTTSIGYGYPNLITAFEEDDWATYAAQPPSGTLKLNSQEVFVFLEKLWNDLLPRLKPLSAYYHTGGDEVNKNAYRFDETVNSSDPAVLQPYMQSFVNFNHDAVRHAGMVPIVWEEMLLEWNLTLGRDVVVQTWQSSAAVQQVVAKGHKALVGNYNFWYLDCGQGQWIDFPPDSSEGFWPYADYCSPRKNWRLIYSLDPLDGIPANQTHLVIGGEAHIWGEQTDAVNVDRMVWPRAAAVAEVLWSGAKDAEGRNRSQVEASPRLAEMRERLVTRGVGSEPVHMPYCTMEDKGCIW